MSFFGNLQGGGIKGPDVVINGDGGSLLPSSSSGIRFSSAHINQQNQLLSGVTAYDYGQGSVSDDIAYQVTPHKIQKIVPQFRIPSSRTDQLDHDILLSHAVSDGDLAFTIRIVHDRASRLENHAYFEKQNITRAVDPIINLATVNYILRGLQTHMGANDDNWKAFVLATGWPIETDTYNMDDFRGGDYQHRNISLFIQDYIRPLGVVIGRDNQGGQHQGSNGAVDFPVDHVVTILVDGLCDNMMNLWRRTEIRAGCDLLLALVGVQMQDDVHKPKADGPTSYKDENRKQGVLPYQVFAEGGIDPSSYVVPGEQTEYVLNHWAPNQLRQFFAKKPHLLFELVTTTSVEIDESYFLGYNGRNRGLWHIARSQTYIRVSEQAQRAQKQSFRDDSVNLRGGALLQVTVAPTWKHATSQPQKKFHIHPVVHAEPLETKSSIVVGSSSSSSVGPGVGSSVYPVDSPLYLNAAIARREPATDTGNTSTGSAVKRNAAGGSDATTGSDITMMSITMSDNAPKRAATNAARAKKSVMDTDVDVSHNIDMQTDAGVVVDHAVVDTTASRLYARSVVPGAKSVSVVRLAAKKSADAHE
ncbi:hypothetical protein T484DRAFT_3631785 [Baffinella frigidus]|nr:hypothetical protein T484DRAFT_3631785 [Cryptophyta sp. CCMP2293]